MRLDKGIAVDVDAGIVLGRVLVKVMVMGTGGVTTLVETKVVDELAPGVAGLLGRFVEVVGTPVDLGMLTVDARSVLVPNKLELANGLLPMVEEANPGTPVTLGRGCIGD